MLKFPSQRYSTTCSDEDSFQSANNTTKTLVSLFCLCDHSHSIETPHASKKDGKGVFEKDSGWSKNRSIFEKTLENLRHSTLQQSYLQEAVSKFVEGFLREIRNEFSGTVVHTDPADGFSMSTSRSSVRMDRKKKARSEIIPPPPAVSESRYRALNCAVVASLFAADRLV